jgi:hypothetical protein
MTSTIVAQFLSQNEAEPESIREDKVRHLFCVGKKG